MMLSTEQTRAVMHGLDNRLSWHEVERPVGPHPLPTWCTGVHVDWAEGYNNSPRVALKANGNLRHWPDQRFVCEGGRFYRARHADGRMEQYAHDGRVSLDKVRMFRSEDGTLRQYARQGPKWYKPTPGVTVTPAYGYEPGGWVDVEMLCTTRQQGFGGSQIHLPMEMEDGRTIVLRGPWHTSGPAGYAEVSYVDTERYTAAYRRNRPWHKVGGTGGLYLREDVFVAILARFVPHLPLASVTYAGATSIEPFKVEWGEPKALVYEREFQVRKAALEAATVAA